MDQCGIHLFFITIPKFNAFRNYLSTNYRYIIVECIAENSEATRCLREEEMSSVPLCDAVPTVEPEMKSR